MLLRFETTATQGDYSVESGGQILQFSPLYNLDKDPASDILLLWVYSTGRG